MRNVIWTVLEFGVGVAVAAMAGSLLMRALFWNQYALNRLLGNPKY